MEKNSGKIKIENAGFVPPPVSRRERIFAIKRLILNYQSHHLSLPDDSSYHRANARITTLQGILRKLEEKEEGFDFTRKSSNKVKEAITSNFTELFRRPNLLFTSVSVNTKQNSETIKCSILVEYQEEIEDFSGEQFRISEYENDFLTENPEIDQVHQNLSYYIP